MIFHIKNDFNLGEVIVLKGYPHNFYNSLLDNILNGDKFPTDEENFQ